jgi:carboxyl-terminal processing protease
MDDDQRQMLGGIVVLACMVAIPIVDMPPTDRTPASRGARSIACDSADAYRNDADAAVRAIQERYAYLSNKEVDWDRARSAALRDASAARSKRDFVGVLEALLDNLHDPHATLKANTAHSPRLVPSGLDLWAEWRGAKAVVTAVRPGFSAEQAGIRPGMIVITVNGVPTDEAATARLGSAIRRPAPRAALAWALLSALAGRHDVPRTLRVRDAAGHDEDVALDLPQHRRVDDRRDEPLVESRRVTVARGTATDSLAFAYIRLNALGDTASVQAFDSALAELRGTRGLILDLRNTPGGGNTDVAEPILGRLIARAAGYQRVIPRHGRPYVRTVQPRGPWRYAPPLVVLVGRWTGSMGEGMAIGLDGMHRGVVVGTRMAGLAGAVDDVALHCTGFTLAFPTARLLSMSGIAREHWEPPVLVDLTRNAGDGEQHPPAPKPRPEPVTADRVLDCGVMVLRSLESGTRASSPRCSPRDSQRSPKRSP